ncbi:hypothetical protein [Streptomyces sp. NPDC048577]|uniref:hypothetical protein n=1 Tax=Streptomyces sp. NPDC048577 TaxID=3157209 RepID=UPI0034487EB3
MDLRARVARAALARPAVLLTASPGATRERLAVEAEIGRRGWSRADAPASANLLVFAGTPRRLGGEDWAERVWRAVPGPKARVTITEAEGAGAALDRGHALLLAAAGQSSGGRGGRTGRRPDREVGHGPHDGPGRDDAHGPDGGPPDHRQGGHRSVGSGDAGPGGHAHAMGGVAGLPLAERGDDRDGLRLDLLHVPLGPALTEWPAGLVVYLELQGDVVRGAEVDTVPGASPARPAFWNEPWLRALAGEPVTVGEAARRTCAAHLDSLGRFLGVAGWRTAAVRARTARDRALAGAGEDELRGRVTPLARRLRGSWTLRWLTAGVGASWEEPGGVDAHRRLILWLDAVERGLADLGSRDPLSGLAPVGPRGPVDPRGRASGTPLDALPGLLRGTEFACARLIVASVDPDLDEPPAPDVPGGRAHG